MKRVVSAFLLVVVILGLLPTPAFALDPYRSFDYGRSYRLQCEFGQYKDPGFGINSNHTIEANGSYLVGYWDAFTDGTSISLNPIDQNPEDQLVAFQIDSSLYSDVSVQQSGARVALTLAYEVTKAETLISETSPLDIALGESVIPITFKETYINGASNDGWGTWDQRSGNRDVHTRDIIRLAIEGNVFGLQDILNSGTPDRSSIPDGKEGDEQRRQLAWLKL